jgi:hypothetical protein
MRLAVAFALFASPALADSPDAWEEFAQNITRACLALVQDPGLSTIEVSPHGSQSYGAALVTLTADYGTDRMICIYEKLSGVAELTTPLPQE